MDGLFSVVVWILFLAFPTTMRRRIGVVEEEPNDHQDDKGDIRYEGECPDEVEADCHTDRSKDVE